MCYSHVYVCPSVRLCTKAAKPDHVNNVMLSYDVVYTILCYPISSSGTIFSGAKDHSEIPIIESPKQWRQTQVGYFKIGDFRRIFPYI